MPRDRVKWSRLVAEGLVIVVSVLLALAAEATWSAFQSRETALQALDTVLEELQDHRRSLLARHRLFERTLSGTTALFRELVATELDATISVSDTLAAQLTWISVSEPATPVVEGFVQEGQIQHLENAAIGPALLQWTARVQDMSSDEARAARHVDDQVIPYVQESGYVALIDIPPGFTSTLSGVDVGVTRLRSTGRLRGLAGRHMAYLTLLTQNTSRAMPALDSLIALVQGELGRSGVSRTQDG